jgi:hypothetical protein
VLFWQERFGRQVPNWRLSPGEKGVVAPIVQRVGPDAPNFSCFVSRALDSKIERYEDTLCPVEQPREHAMMLHKEQPMEMVIPIWHFVIDGTGPKAETLCEPIFTISASV